MISAAGLCSRRTAEAWIAQGKVTVNGVLARLGDTADPETDEILVEGRPLPAAPARTTTVLLCKPRGYVTTLSDERGRPAVWELLPPELGRLYPVGRLDQFSEGLLLMTNDGALANALTHPRGEVDKTYRLWVSGWHEAALDLLRRPIVLDGRPIKPPLVRLLWTREAPDKAFPLRGRWHGEAVTDEVASGSAAGRSEASACRKDTSSAPVCTLGHLPLKGKAVERVAGLEITIHEGRNRQIRRMAEAAGLTPTRLKRVAEGPIALGDLKPGQWRPLTEAELRQLKTEAQAGTAR